MEDERCVHLQVTKKKSLSRCERQKKIILYNFYNVIKLTGTKKERAMISKLNSLKQLTTTAKMRVQNKQSLITERAQRRKKK